MRLRRSRANVGVQSSENRWCLNHIIRKLGSLPSPEFSKAASRLLLLLHALVNGMHWTASPLSWLGDGQTDLVSDPQQWALHITPKRGGPEVAYPPLTATFCAAEPMSLCSMLARFKHRAEAPCPAGKHIRLALHRNVHHY